MGLAFLNIGIATSLLGTVGIWRRMPRLGLTSRNRAFVWVLTGIALMAISPFIE